MKARALITALGLALASPAISSSHQSSVGAIASPATEAEVRKVDREAKKITLKHREIRNLEMPPMTMVFVVRDESMLDRVKAGDKVRFTAEKVGGAFTITSIDTSK